jgi:hypothetical protein
MNNRSLTALLFALLIVGFSITANASTYQVVTTYPGQTWNDARSQAQSLGAGWDLASITTLSENNFIASLLGPGYDREEFWIGAERVAGSTFKWVSGEAWTYQNWWNGEPNGDGIGAVLDWRGAWGWNDEGSAPQQVIGFIAENNAPVPEPGTLVLLGLGMTGLAIYNKRRRNN